MSFYKNLEDICFDRGMTINRLLVELGMSKSNSKSWSNGAIPQVGTMRKIADYLDVSVEDLTQDKKPAPTPAVCEDGMQDRLIAIYDELDLIARARLLVYAQDLKNENVH